MDGGFVGSDGVVHTWDMRMRRCLSRAVDEGCFCSTSLAASADGRLYATGSKAGVVNIYNRSFGCCLAHFSPPVPNKPANF